MISSYRAAHEKPPEGGWALLFRFYCITLGQASLKLYHYPFEAWVAVIGKPAANRPITGTPINCHQGAIRRSKIERRRFPPRGVKEDLEYIICEETDK